MSNWQEEDASSGAVVRPPGDAYFTSATALNLTEQANRLRAALLSLAKSIDHSGAVPPPTSDVFTRAQRELDSTAALVRSMHDNDGEAAVREAAAAREELSVEESVGIVVRQMVETSIAAATERVEQDIENQREFLRASAAAPGGTALRPVTASSFKGWLEERARRGKQGGGADGGGGAGRRGGGAGRSAQGAPPALVIDDGSAPHSGGAESKERVAYRKLRAPPPQRTGCAESDMLNLARRCDSGASPPNVGNR